MDGETVSAIPSAAAARASSGQDQRASGLPLAAGSSQARAFTPATTRAGNFRGRPGRGASASPSMPPSWYRRRHLRAVSSQIPSRAAITLFARPSAASSTIRELLGPAWHAAFNGDLANITPLRFLAAGYAGPHTLRRLGRERRGRR